MPNRESRFDQYEVNPSAVPFNKPTSLLGVKQRCFDDDQLSINQVSPKLIVTSIFLTIFYGCDQVHSFTNEKDRQYFIEAGQTDCISFAKHPFRVVVRVLCRVALRIVRLTDTPCDRIDSIDRSIDHAPTDLLSDGSQQNYPIKVLCCTVSLYHCILS